MYVYVFSGKAGIGCIYYSINMGEEEWLLGVG